MPPNDIVDAVNLVALLWFFSLTIGYQAIMSHDPIYRRSISAAIQKKRVQWMREMARRDVRIVDAQLLNSLTQGSGFFASTSLIVAGGLSTLMGSGHEVQVTLERLPFVAKSSTILWELKLLLLLAIFVFAFFKFAWAFRLAHYASIMIGACPTRREEDGAECAKCDEHAAATAKLIGISATHNTVGLRAFYHAIAAVSWFIHPLLFIATSTYVIIVLIRRDFFSHSLAAISIGDGTSTSNGEGGDEGKGERHASD